MPGRSRRFGWFLAVLILIAALAVFHTAVLAGCGAFLVRADGPSSADFAVVLAGDPEGNRILTAAGLARRGLVQKVVVSGPGSLYGFHESDLAIRFAGRRGYAENLFIPAPNECKSTSEEVHFLADFLHRLGAHSIDLVTSNYHTRRAGKLFRAAARDIDVHVVAAPDTYFQPATWWMNREGRKVFAFEWMKTAATWMGL